MSKDEIAGEYASPRESLRRRQPNAAEDRMQQSYVDYERQQLVLRYKAYFVEPIQGSAIERWRARVVRLDYFVEDETLRVFEPREDNSGLIQGVILKRHKAKTDEGVDVTVDTLRIGSSVSLFGVEYCIVDADKRTREWLASTMGVTLGDAQGVPLSYHHPSTHNSHRAKKTTVVYDVGYKENPDFGFYSREGDTRGQFQANCGKVLRFEVEWMDTQRTGSAGDARTLLLQYYLADDTVELIEPPYNNSGRGPFVKVLARQRLPSFAVRGGEQDGKSRLGFISEEESAAELAAELAAKRMRQRYRYSRGSDSRYHHNSPITGAPLYEADGASEGTTSTTPYVTAADLVCGRVISVYGKPLRLRRCDPFSVRWYQSEMGVQQQATFATDSRGAGAMTLLPPSQRYTSAPPAVPPHVGALAIGDEEETRRNANKLVPTFSLKYDVEKGYKQAGKVLRYRAKLVTDSPTEGARRFVLSYYLEDDTASIFEVADANSGLRRGKFLDRGRYFVLGDADEVGSVDATQRLAAERAFGGIGYIMGYEHGFGQGYAGGPLGRESRVGAGGTGVALARGVGVHGATVSSLAAAAAMGKPLRPVHLGTGQRIVLAHARAQMFELLGADAFTESMEEELGIDSLRGGEGAAGATKQPSTPLAQARKALLAVLSGCMDSARVVCKQAESRVQGAAHASTVRRALRQYGALPPMVGADQVDMVIEAHTIKVDSSAAEHVPPEAVGLVDFEGLFVALEKCQEGLQALAWSDDKLLGQLRYALLSSRTHLRAVFRDLGVEVAGAITAAEFRRMLRRHNLDLGMNDEQLARAMSIFPAASEVQGAPAGSISLRGFVALLVDAHTLSAGAFDDFLVVVMGVRAPLVGAGMAPEVYSHVNKRNLWEESAAAAAPSAPLDTSADESAEQAGSRDPAASGTPSRGSGSQRSTPREEARVSPSKDPAPATTYLSSYRHSRMGGESDPGTLLERMTGFFQFKRSTLLNVMGLYDTSGSGRIRLTSLVSALESAGFEMSPMEQQAFLSAMAPAADKGFVQYREFVKQLFA